VRDLHVVIVDDDPAAALFALSGRVHTYTCRTLAAAAAALGAIRPDAVVLDLSLPGSSPHDAARTVRSLFAGRVVVSSGLDPALVRRVADEIEATALPKPHLAADLLAACTGGL
jgi:DNA-binding response OmpR family regulator